MGKEDSPGVLATSFCRPATPMRLLIFAACMCQHDISEEAKSPLVRGNQSIGAPWALCLSFSEQLTYCSKLNAPASCKGSDSTSKLHVSWTASTAHQYTTPAFYVGQGWLTGLGCWHHPAHVLDKALQKQASSALAPACRHTLSVDSHIVK